MGNDRHNSIKTRIIEKEEDVDGLKFGDVVGVEGRGLMRYHDKVDGLYLFFGRGPQGKGMVEIWFAREQLKLGKYGLLRTKRYYNKEFYQSNVTDKNQEGLSSYIDKKLEESGL